MQVCVTAATDAGSDGLTKFSSYHALFLSSLVLNGIPSLARAEPLGILPAAPAPPPPGPPGTGKPGIIQKIKAALAPVPTGPPPDLKKYQRDHADDLAKRCRINRDTALRDAHLPTDVQNYAANKLHAHYRTLYGFFKQGPFSSYWDANRFEGKE